MPIELVGQTPYQRLGDGRLIPLMSLGADAIASLRKPTLEPLSALIEPFNYPSEMDFRGQLTPVRDQARRGTCTGFAMVAALEFHYQTDLSEQFAYWAGEMAEGNNGEGLWLRAGVPALQREGTVLETAWNYVPDPIPGNSAQHPPPDAALQSARFRFGQIGGESGNNARIPGLIALLMAQQRIPAMFSFGIPASGLPDNGIVDVPGGSPDPVAAHTVLLSGYNAPGQFFPFKNSWRSDWGDQGYGRMSFAYVQRYGLEVFGGLRAT